MARRSSPTALQPANLSAIEMQRAIPLLERRIQELREFDPNSVRDRSDPRIQRLGQDIDRTLVKIFGPDSLDYERYRQACEIDHGPNIVGGTPLHEVVTGLEDGKANSIVTIEGIIDGLREEMEFPSDFPATEASTITNTRKVFVVHGHDEAAKQEMARFLEKIGLDAVILQEQPSKSQTIIEKLEGNSEVGFAVVLLTPDDIGASTSKNESTKPRARQNVIFELGYFIGKLGRGRVCLMTKGGIEILSDLHGVIYIPMDASGGWKFQLAKEMKAAAMDIDFNKVAEA